MKKLLLLTACIMIGFYALAQTQQGYVKTKGRMDAQGKLLPGHGLKGTTVSIQGRTAVLVNQDDGSFSFPVTASQFRLDSVKKKGYQLVDHDACPKTYTYSKNPLYIVMETPDQQLQDQLTAERKIRRNLQKQLQEKEDALEAMKAQQTISDEAYRQALQQLYQDQESNEQLIKGMARRYAALDYDQLDEFYRQVSFCIENGALVKADSLLKTKGDVAKQVEEQLQRSQAIQEQEAELDKAKTVHAADQEELARRCYSYFETYAAQHKNEAAAHYLELRAKLDTTNVGWQTEAGLFISDYLADYNTALTYYQSALKQVLASEGLMNRWAALLLGNIGAVSTQIGDYNSALSYQENALTITKRLFGEYDPETAQCYDNLGTAYSDLGKYNDALECHNKALSIWQSILGEDHPDLAQCYNNTGSVYYYLDETGKALEFHTKALEIRKKAFGENHPLVAVDYNNIGTVYTNLGEYDKALEYLGHALSIWQSVLGEDHPDVAQCYNNFGVAHFLQGDYDTALDYFRKALGILQPVFGDQHPDVKATKDIILKATERLNNGKK